MRVLGLDLGEKRIGLAISDEGASIAFPAGSIQRTGLRRDLAALRKLVRDRDVARVVVGLPIHMNGRRGPEAEAADRFAAALAEAAGVPVDTLDERWTTLAAERTFRETGTSGRRRAPGTVDAVAAALLLSTYLERRRATGRERE